MIHVYWAGSDAPNMEQYLKYIRSELTWVPLTIETWPDADPYGDGFLDKFRVNPHLDHFHDWAVENLRCPALVLTRRQMRRDSKSVAPATGVTRWPVSLVTTTFEEKKGGRIPDDVVARTALHEVAHLIRGHRNLVIGEDAVKDLDNGEHCSLETACILNSSAGKDAADVELKILARPIAPKCAPCIEAREFTKTAPEWVK